MKIDRYKELLGKYLTGTDDETLKDLEELTTDLPTDENTATEDYNRGYSDCEKVWREKYRERFLSSEKIEDEKEGEEEEKSSVTLEDLEEREEE